MQADTIFSPLRIIPALAGSTYDGDTPDVWLSDHPRACGEHVPMNKRAGLPRGSSPRLRGARKASTSTARPSRIIPALAGSTVHTPGTSWGSGDHPRACGEHVRPLRGMKLTLGSSPRLRGAP